VELWTFVSWRVFDMAVSGPTSHNGSLAGAVPHCLQKTVLTALQEVEDALIS